jgi:hypothetical protein
MLPTFSTIILETTAQRQVESSLQQQNKPQQSTTGFVLIQYDIAQASGKIIQRLAQESIFSIGNDGIYFTVDQAPEADIFLLRLTSEGQ